MTRHERFFTTEQAYLNQIRPENPVLFFNPPKLAQQFQLFLDHFPGLVSFAVKAQPSPEVIRLLARAGMAAFDVASPVEMALVREHAPLAALHYNNPIRSQAEIKAAIGHHVVSYAIDRPQELEKLLKLLPSQVEISVRLKLDTKGGKIDFGSKFGADAATCEALLRRIVKAGHIPSMCFHPGTQCLNTEAWEEYIAACAKISKRAEITLKRLNVGGGFPSRRLQETFDLRVFFERIKMTVTQEFGQDAPQLLCEPGRAMVAEAFSLATRIKAVADGQIFLNDGIYGGLSEMRDIGSTSRILAHRTEAGKLSTTSRKVTIFGPTCDSLDVLPDPVALPLNIAEGDYLIFEAMGAYSTAIATRFNGYGDIRPVTLIR